MSKRALIVCTIASFLQFELNDLKLLAEKGYEIHCATNFDGSEFMYEKLATFHVINHQVDFARSPFSRTNLKALGEVKRIMRDIHFDLVHCHTPVGGVVARLAAKTHRKKGTKVIYTAHGFHFYTGAPKLYWLIFYPIEKWLSRYTDVLITINTEDHARAERFSMGRLEYVPGVGIDLTRFGAEHNTGIQGAENGIWLMSVGELNENKNHETVIRAIADREDIYYTIAGIGPLEQHLKELIAELHLEKRVFLLGYRRDVPALFAAADIYIHPSYREGLSVSIMEAMASGLPVICSKIRGNKDLIDENGGFLFDPHSMEACRESIAQMLEADRDTMGQYNMEKIKKFSIEVVQKKMAAIYESVER
ncbi:MAG: glycosyltransferase family 4 protein [Acetatifactor sp.]|nr:glycosyltransferase family 4 protein [Acetatifactor sp.]